MNKLLSVSVIFMVLYLAAYEARVNSGKYRSTRIRLNPSSIHRRFRLISNPRSASPALGKFGLRRRRPISSSLGGRPVRRRLGPVAALRGQGGSYDFSNQVNSVIPDKQGSKPIKESSAKTSNPNKINIESKLNTKPVEDFVIEEKVHVGETAIVHCTFDTTGRIGAYRQAKIWWTKLSQRVVDRPVILAAGTQVRIPDDRLRVVTFPDNTFSILVIKNVLPEDAGRYKCSLPTITGTETTFTKLVVLEAKSDNIAISPKESSLNSGDELNLFCKPDDQRLKVWWTAKDATGNNIDVTRGFDKVAGKTLTIRNIQRNQAGVYTCHVQLAFGSPIRRHFTVQVKERPWPVEAYISGFKVNTLLAKYNKNPTYGDNVNLRCDSGGVPVPSIKWYKGGRILSNSYKYSLTSYEPSFKENSVISKLTIKNFQKYDEGKYECKAENEAGTEKQEFDVEGAPDQPTPVPSDDEDIDRQSALKGRKGQLKISICKAGRPCRTSQPASGNRRRHKGNVEDYSGDGY